jgi:hypothetical protein
MPETPAPPPHRAPRSRVDDAAAAIRRPFPVALRLVLGLAALVFTGTLLLSLPGVTTGPRLTPIEALFTATSASRLPD